MDSKKTTFLSPDKIACAMIAIGKTKANLSISRMLLLGILAGAFIGFGSELATITCYDMPKYLGVGFTKFMFGSVFSVGLMVVIIAGAELFTGNNLILIRVLNREGDLGKMFKSWFWVYVANFLGSLLLVWIMFGTGIWKTGNFAVGAEALAIAHEKVNLSWWEAFARGIGCNWLVCLAVWIAVASKDVTGKILGIYFPIMAFVASGFEHCVANMYFIPMGLLLKGNATVVAAAGLAGKLNNLTLQGFFVNNLIPVTLGNIIGGSFCVATVYWLAYLRKSKK
ncbi:formate/nitrite transporter family protein [Candidatus Atribacteria bacterium 1244-E10-H5-B2]|nr:MAG: formate/nitrite transporter family protein [Candidatus Atribacteria bacterium 1244-E10-H5-B2]